MNSVRCSIGLSSLLYWDTSSLMQCSLSALFSKYSNSVSAAHGSTQQHWISSTAHSPVQQHSLWWAQKLLACCRRNTIQHYMALGLFGTLTLDTAQRPCGTQKQNPLHFTSSTGYSTQSSNPAVQPVSSLLARSVLAAQGGTAPTFLGLHPSLPCVTVLSPYSLVQAAGKGATACRWR